MNDEKLLTELLLLQETMFFGIYDMSYLLDTSNSWLTNMYSFGKISRNYRKPIEALVSFLKPRKEEIKGKMRRKIKQTYGQHCSMKKKIVAELYAEFSEFKNDSANLPSCGPAPLSNNLFVIDQPRLLDGEKAEGVPREVKS